MVARIYTDQIKWEPEPREEWMEKSNCKDVIKTDPDFFFHTERGMLDEQRAICNGNVKDGQPVCAVRMQCLAFTMATEQPGYRRFGFAGGKTGAERQRLAELLNPTKKEEKK